MNKPAFILASSSPRRLALLADIGIVPDKVVAADIEEVPQPKEKPRSVALRLSLEKLQAVAPSLAGQNAYVLSADTVVGVGRRILPKAQTPRDVARFLTLMAGRRHRVFTGVALQTPQGKILQKVSESTIIFRLLSPDEIEAYAACGEGLGKAGGYAIQGRAAAFTRYLSGSYSGIVGLPLYEVAQMLRGAGWRF